MRYWVLDADGRDARGPFEVADLKKLPGFSAESMVAPETATDASTWKAAKLHDQLRALFARPSDLRHGPGHAGRPRRYLVLAMCQVLIGAVSLSGCATFFYSDSWNRSEDMKASPAYLSGREQIVAAEKQNFIAGLIFQLTPLGMAAPIFGYPHKSQVYSQTAKVQIDPPEAAARTGTTHEFHARPGVPETWTLDFDQDAVTTFKSTGRVTVYKPRRLTITVSCDKRSCSATAEPPIVGPTGIVHLESQVFENRRHLQEIAREQRKEEETRKAAGERSQLGLETTMKSLPRFLRGETDDREGNLSRAVADPFSYSPVAQSQQFLAIDLTRSEFPPQWLPVQGDGNAYYVGFANAGHTTWSEVVDPHWHVHVANPRQIAPAGFLNFKLDGTTATLSLGDSAWHSSQVFVARVAGDAWLQFRPGDMGTFGYLDARERPPIFGLFLEPIAVYGDDGAWKIVDPAIAALVNSSDYDTPTQSGAHRIGSSPARYRRPRSEAPSESRADKEGSAAIILGKHFPIAVSGEKVTVIGISDGLQLRRGIPRTLEERIASLNLMMVSVDLEMLQNGLTNRDAILNKHRLVWTASHLKGPRYRILCQSPSMMTGGRNSLYLLEVNLATQSVKPLTLGTWYLIDPKGSFAWEEHWEENHPAAGVDFDVSAVASMYPARR